jgi:D-alanyl-D-alanine dipeptidase
MKQYSISQTICKNVKTVDSREPLVNLALYSKVIAIGIGETSRRALKLKPGACFVRESVAKRLAKAQSYLPKGLHLKIESSYRPLSVQIKIQKQFLREVKRRNPKISDEQANLEVDKWVANPKKVIPPHSTGGAIDLTIVSDKGEELDMGSSDDSMTPKSWTNARISKLARKNRNILIYVMSRAGFANYKREWWHWSYGEWGWAYANNRKSAIYGII